MNIEIFLKKLAEKLGIEEKKLKELFSKLSNESKNKFEELEKAIKEDNFELVEKLLKDIKELTEFFENFSILFTEYKNNEDIESLKVWESIKEKIFALTN